MTSEARRDRAATIWLVPHTHWDREWYEPFQRFRLRLLDLMDDVVARAEREPAFRFTMDGQMAAVDDYLEVRPEQTSAVADLVRSGRLAIGPWRVLMDEFLCSGETMLRNLEIGRHDAARLGPSMQIGYLPDMFGHCAQMPQLLQHSGIEQACVYRGVPAAVTGHEFWWVAPDGTGIRTEYLANSYGNAADLFVDDTGADAATRLLERYAVQSGWYHGDDFLAMYGTDHAAPLPTLVAQVARLDADPHTPPMRLATLADYLAEPRTPSRDLQRVEGELRSHARANLLPGVLSVRWQLKQAMADAEVMLIRYAEPFAALHLRDAPHGYLDLAWRRVVDSSCHDSVTGCGVDETAVQVAARLAEATQAAQAVRDRVIAAACAANPIGSVVALNPVAAQRSDLVEIVVELPPGADGPAAVALRDSAGRACPIQVIATPDRELANEQVRSADLTRLMHRVHDRELFGIEVERVQIDPAGLRVDFQLADHGSAAFDAVATEHRLAEAAAAQPDDALWTVTTTDSARVRLLAHLTVPALGWAAFEPVAATDESAADVVPLTHPVVIEADGAAMGNGLCSVRLAADGTVTIVGADGTTLSGVGRLVDGGDCGDSYNYGPPENDRLIDRPTSVTVAADRHGPLAGAWVVVRTYDLPASSGRSGRSTEIEPTRIVTRYELRAGEPFLRIGLRWDNRSADHRLRVHVPLARPSSTSAADGQFAVVTRGRRAEAGPVGEYPIPTFPAERFVDAGGAGVLLGRTVEYELIGDDDGHGPGAELAITVLRASGYLSRNVHPWRSEPAGPNLATPEGQVLGPASIELAVLAHAGDWQAGRLAHWYDLWRHPVAVGRGSAPRGGQPVPLTDAPGLSVAGDGVQLVSCRTRPDEADGAIEVRLLNGSPEDSTARITLPGQGIRAATRCLADGTPTDEPVRLEEGTAEIDLRGWQLATVRLSR